MIMIIIKINDKIVMLIIMEYNNIYGASSQRSNLETIVHRNCGIHPLQKAKQQKSIYTNARWSTKVFLSLSFYSF